MNLIVLHFTVTIKWIKVTLDQAPPSQGLMFTNKFWLVDLTTSPWNAKTKYGRYFQKIKKSTEEHLFQSLNHKDKTWQVGTAGGGHADFHTQDEIKYYSDLGLSGRSSMDFSFFEIRAY